MRLTLSEVQHTQRCGQSQGSQHVDESPVPVQRHPPRVRTLVDLAKGEVAKDWEDDKGWVVDDHPCSILQTSQGLVERGECNDGTRKVDAEYVAHQVEPLPWPGYLAVEAVHVDQEDCGESPAGNA